MLINEDPVLNSAVSTLGQSLRETEDQLARSMMEGSAPPINCTSGTNGDNPTNISALDCSKAVRLLRTANAQFIQDMIEGENKFGKMCAEVKPTLIDMEARWGDMAQAKAA
jgi:hypothetical protein